MKRTLTSKILTYVFAAVVMICSVFPIYWVVVSSLRGAKYFFADSQVLIPNHISFEYYQNLLRFTNYLTYYKNSLIVAVIATAVSTLVSSQIAYVTSRFVFFGSRWLMNVMLIAYMLPAMLIAIPLIGIYIKLGIDNTLFALIISHISITLPFGVWMLDSFYRTIPVELEESSMVEGASRFQTMFKVVIPLIIPGLITVEIFSFIVSWTDYTYGFMIISSENLKTVPVGLATIRGAGDLRWGELLAGASLILVPMTVVFSFVSKYFIGGLTSGAVKG
ncbi:carbohydrate ABC transporter permease [Cohnella caldifontis]|uniref:carbohydrate ABC transporter permease n=1 Tax=Cohnella caldifontis TaxID=3027471 RepID=UPI0023ED0BA1|nr:carbohydrate ABC transporter permease [Cohnella sp. YIM B05605]